MGKTLFQSEVGTYLKTGKQHILFNLPIPLIVFPSKIGKLDDEVYSYLLGKQLPTWNNNNLNNNLYLYPYNKFLHFLAGNLIIIQDICFQQ